MTAHAARGNLADPFGRTIAERVWRRLAGAGVAVMVSTTGFTLWVSDVLPFALIGTAVVYLLGGPASWLVARRAGAPVSRHLLAGLVVGALTAAVLALLSGSPSSWPAFAVVTIGIGLPVAAVAAWSGLALPDPWVKPLAVVGLLFSAGVLPLATWWESRPPAPYDFVVVQEPATVQHQVAGPAALAREIADRFEDHADRGQDPTAHATWVAIGQGLNEDLLSGAAAWIRFTPDDELPAAPASDGRVRLVTTIFDGHPDRGCVVVTDTRIRAQPHGCAEIDLVP